MASKTIIRIGVIAALALVCGLCGLTGFGTFNWLTNNVPLWDVWENGTHSSQVTETRTLAAVPNLEITSDTGDVKVTAADVDEIEVEMIKTAWAATDEEAEAAAAALTVRVVEGVDTLSLVYDKPEEINLGWRAGPDSVDFIIRVPAETSVDLHTAFGRIIVTGLDGDAVLETDFGDVEVEDLTGALTAGSSNASITANRIEAGEGVIDLHTNFGGISLEDASANEITVRSSNGEIAVRSVTAAGLVHVENQFGGIEVIGVRAETLEIDDQNGRVEVEVASLDKQITVTNDFGDVSVTGVSAPAFAVKSSNGDVTVEGATGSLVVETTFGDITVLNADQVTLDLKGSNGSIEFSGTLAQTGHTIRNSFGDISLTIPADSAFSLSLDTEFGDIRSEIPLAVTGTLESQTESDHWEAEINGGGPLLQAKTSNGDVVIHILPVPAGP